MNEADGKWAHSLNTVIEVIDECCHKVDVVSFDVPSGELLGLQGDFSLINALLGHQSQKICQR